MGRIRRGRLFVNRGKGEISNITPHTCTLALSHTRWNEENRNDFYARKFAGWQVSTLASSNDRTTADTDLRERGYSGCIQLLSTMLTSLD